MQARCRDRRRAGSRRPMLLTLGHHESQCLTDSEESRAHYLSAEGHLSCIISQRLSLCCFGRLFAMCSPKTTIMLATKREQTRKNAVWPYDHYLILRDGHHHQSLTIKVSIIVVMPVTPRRSRSHSQTVICTRRVPSASQPASQAFGNPALPEVNDCCPGGPNNSLFVHVSSPQEQQDPTPQDAQSIYHTILHSQQDPLQRLANNGGCLSSKVFSPPCTCSTLQYYKDTEYHRC